MAFLEREMCVVQIVELIYNPFSQSASLRINGKNFSRPGSRLDDFLIGKPASRWLSPSCSGYSRWEGILTEIVTEINTDCFTMKFVGLPGDYELFKTGVKEQSVYLDEWGYSADEIVICYVKQFTSDQIVQKLRRLRKKCDGNLSTQELYILRDNLDDFLNGPVPETIEDTRELFDLFHRFLDRWYAALKNESLRQREAVRTVRSQLEKVLNYEGAEDIENG